MLHGTFLDSFDLMMEDLIGLLILCLKMAVHGTLLFFIFVGYSAFLCFVRKNENSYLRALNVLFCHLAILYQVHIFIQSAGTVSVLGLNIPLPADIMFQKVNMLMGLARGLLFFQITMFTYMKYV